MEPAAQPTVFVRVVAYALSIEAVVKAARYGIDTLHTLVEDVLRPDPFVEATRDFEQDE